LQLSSFLLCFAASDPAPIFMVIHGWAKQFWVNSKTKGLEHMASKLWSSNRWP
jgi:hypothetical protein